MHLGHQQVIDARFKGLDVSVTEEIETALKEQIGIDTENRHGARQPLVKALQRIVQVILRLHQRDFGRNVHVRSDELIGQCGCHVDARAGDAGIAVEIGSVGLDLWYEAEIRARCPAGEADLRQAAIGTPAGHERIVDGLVALYHAVHAVIAAVVKEVRAPVQEALTGGRDAAAEILEVLIVRHIIEDHAQTTAVIEHLLAMTECDQ